MGSYIEEKIAIGTTLLIISSKKLKKIEKSIKEVKLKYLKKDCALIFLKRKERVDIFKTIKLIDPNSLIYIFKAHQIDYNKIKT